jgi:hypothetical protein
VRRRLALALTAALALGMALPAAATIVPQHSIAGVKLGMTEKRVRALKGKPLAVRKSRNDFGTFRELVYARVRVGFQSGSKVTAVSTTSPKERTARGLGIGSSVEQIKAALKGVRCKKEFGIDHCWLGADWKPGAVVTDLMLKHGRVSRVTIGYVID